MISGGEPFIVMLIAPLFICFGKNVCNSVREECVFVGSLASRIKVGVRTFVGSFGKIWGVGAGEEAVCARAKLTELVDGPWNEKIVKGIDDLGKFFASYGFVCGVANLATVFLVLSFFVSRGNHFGYRGRRDRQFWRVQIE